MGWTSVFIEVKNKKIFIVGTGEVGIRRAKRFLKEGAEVILAGNSIPEELKKEGAILKPIENLEKWVEWSDIVIIASGDEKLNDYISSISDNKLLNRADLPEKGNLIVPTEFNIEDIKISIFTNGKSPLMARELRKKIQNTIHDEDILQIKLQEYARNILKEKVENQKLRKKYLYEIFKDEKIKYFLKEKDLNQAKEYINSELLKLIK